jgi:DNA-binding NtrC family response regulator
MLQITSTVYTSRCQGRILVVDQDSWCQEFLSQVIKLGGFGEFQLATTVEEAISLLRECGFDVIIADVNLPQYHDLLDEIRQRHPATRLIGMLHQRSQVRTIIHVEQMEIVIKPLCLDEMARKIREAIISKQRHKVEEDIYRLKHGAFPYV